MAIINPFETPEIVLDFTFTENDEQFKVKNTATFGNTLALKLSVTYLKK